MHQAAIKPMFEVGQYVRLVAPAKVGSVIGRVMAHELYTDFNGSRRYYYVCWYSPGGYRGDVEKHAEQELMHEDEEI